jgi:transcriptional regulator with XRE-family HTH domain
VNRTTNAAAKVNLEKTREDAMLSATLRDGLREYAIGDTVRALRLKKKMGLVELGRHTGLSPAMLSKIERGRLFPTLPTLLRIALVFSVGLEYFFAGTRDKPLVVVARRRDRITLPDRPGARDVAYRFQSLDFPASERRFDSFYAEFQAVPADKLRPHAHPGAEFIYLLEGTLTVHLPGDEHVLEPGDAMYFDSSSPHAYRRSRGRRCRAVVVVAR